jgi:probable F420-dependent oxidoreductase
MPLVAEFAEAADEAGFDGLWAQEHLYRPTSPRIGYGARADMPWPLQHRNLLSPMELLAYVAARTRRCTVGTSILVTGYHHPLVLAKRAATLDVLSGGRFALGLGVGWSADEYDVLGVPFERRGAITDELLEVLDACWRGRVEHHGEFFDIPDGDTSPLPVRGRVPIYGGFLSRAARHRVARWCDVWQPFATTPAKAVERLAAINEIAAAEYGRGPLEVSLRVSMAVTSSRDEEIGPIGDWVGGADELAARVAEAADAGCDEVVLDTAFAPGAEEPAFWLDLIDVLGPALAEAHRTDEPSATDRESPWDASSPSST